MSYPVHADLVESCGVAGTVTFDSIKRYQENDVTNFLVDGGTIQAAVDNANPGDIINLLEKIYRENVHIGKSLSLIGAGADKTIVDGDTNGKPIINSEISIDNSRFDGFIDLSNAIFRSDAQFSGATIGRMTFSDSVLFNGTTFNGYATFSGTKFSRNADFYSAIFSGMLTSLMLLLIVILTSLQKNLMEIF